MFAFINTKNATHIAINIPHEGADKTIPALVAMLERNAVFIKSNYSTLETCKPEMSIQLGDKVSLDNNESELVIEIPRCSEILDDSFVKETPEVRISNRKALDKKEAEIQRLRTELAHVRQQLSDLRESIEAAAQREENGTA